MKNQPIGIFDSGIGGLTVLKEIQRLIPSEDLVYFGDTARVPYGNKSKSTIIKFSTESILFLLKKKVKLVVVACNTSSALALNHVRAVFSVPIFGVIEAGVNKALSVSKSKRIGVIGTKSTIESGSYQSLLKQRNSQVAVFSHSCPLFVPLVEEGLVKGPIVNQAISLYLEDLKKNNIDTLILGCTHYPLLKAAITSYLKGVFIIDSAKEVARHTKETLLSNDLLSSHKNKGSVEFYVSDEADYFSKLAKLFLKHPIPKPKKIYV